MLIPLIWAGSDRVSKFSYFFVIKYCRMSEIFSIFALGRTAGPIRAKLKIYIQGMYVFTQSTNGCAVAPVVLQKMGLFCYSN